MVTVSIMQPAYLPWLGFFDRARRSDVVIIMDHVTIDKNTPTQFSNRNRIKLPNGPAWLTVPINSRGEYANAPLCDLRVVNHFWCKKHVKSLQAAYAKAPFFDTYAPAIFDLIQEPRELLVEYTEPLRNFFFTSLDIAPKVLFSSEMAPKTAKSELVLELCEMAGATRYLSGPFGRDYLDIKAFEEARIDLHFHDYEHPSYTQIGQGFEPYMSIVDLLFNHGPDTRAILSAPRGTS